jgi:hypothetical protein
MEESNTPWFCTVHWITTVLTWIRASHWIVRWNLELGLVMQVCSASTQDAEAGELWVPGLPGVLSETLCLKSKQNKTKKENQKKVKFTIS